MVELGVIQSLLIEINDANLFQIRNELNLLETCGSALIRDVVQVWEVRN